MHGVGGDQGKAGHHIGRVDSAVSCTLRFEVEGAKVGCSWGEQRRGGSGQRGRGVGGGGQGVGGRDRGARGGSGQKGRW